MSYVQVHEHSSTSKAALVYGFRMSGGGQDKISLDEIKELFQLRIGFRETCKNRHIYPEFYDKIPWDVAESYPSAYQDKLREFAKGKAQKEGTRRKPPTTETPQTIDSDRDPSAFDITVEGDQNHCSRANMACGASAFSSLRTNLDELVRCEHKDPTLN
ncbi:hypothetical protein B0T13DRAFT_447304 [Neurospora crassa]|nr:hypothetical protein B0T13DRAFT_447304 [Neurospora crassa]